MKKHEQEKDTDLTQETAESGEKAKNKHGKLYYIIVAACALVLVAAIVLMAVFLAPSGGSDVIDDPGGQEEPDEPEEPDDPAGTEVVFFAPRCGCDRHRNVSVLVQLHAQPLLPAHGRRFFRRGGHGSDRGVRG